MGSAATNGGIGGRLPSSPSTVGANEQSDDEEDDDDLRGRWGNNGVVVGGQKPDAKQGHVRLIGWLVWFCPRNNRMNHRGVIYALSDSFFLLRSRCTLCYGVSIRVVLVRACTAVVDRLSRNSNKRKIHHLVENETTYLAN